MMINRFFLLLTLTTLLLLPNVLLAQKVLSGKILQKETYDEISGVIISTSESQTISDEHGKFELTAPEYGDTIRFSLLGYETLDIVYQSGLSLENVLLAQKTTRLTEVIISGVHQRGRLMNIPGAVSVIAPSELERDQDITPVTALNRIPGVYAHSGTLNTNRITIRGIGSRSLFSTNKIKAYINDIPLTSGDGETTIEDIDLQLIDRVEVIKGPNSSLFGAGLGGTINYSTAIAPFNSSSVMASTQFGSFGLRRNVLKARHGDGRKNISLIYTNTDYDGYRENNQYDRNSINVMADFFTGEKDVISVFVNFTELLAFIPSSIDSVAFANDPTSAAFTWNQSKGFEDYNKSIVGVSLDHVYNESWEQQVSLFTNFREAYELRPFNILVENTNSIGFRSSAKYTGARSTWVSGLEYFRDWYQWRTIENNNRQPGSTLSDNQESRNYLNIFSQLDLKLSDKLMVTGGINLNYTNYDYTDLFLIDSLDQSGKYDFGLTFSPRLAALYAVDNSRVLYFNISHGFSPPTLAETLTPEGVINPDISPEQGYNFEFGTRGSLWDQKLEFDFSLYTMLISDLLVARRIDADQFVGVNAGKTTHNGLEAQLKYHLIAEDNIEFSAFLNALISDYHFTEFIDGESDFSGNELTGNPDQLINLGVDFSSANFYAHLNWQYVDKIPINDANTVYSEAYQLTNVKAGYNRSLGKFKIDLYAGINNIFDEKYASMLLVNATAFGSNLPRYYYPGLPRNYFGGLSLTYNFK